MDRFSGFRSMPRSVFLEGAAAHLRGLLDAESFHALTVQHAFRYVLDVYHRLPGGETATEFFQLERGRLRALVLTNLSANSQTPGVVPAKDLGSEDL